MTFRGPVVGSRSASERTLIDGGLAWELRNFAIARRYNSRYFLFWPYTYVPSGVQPRGLSVNCVDYLPATAQQTIGKMVPILAPMQQTKIMVNGYTDNTLIGPELMREGVTSNLVLSQKRADNVMNFMTSQGVNPALVSAQGFGDADPVASNDTPQGRAQNRRVELVLAGSGN